MTTPHPDAALLRAIADGKQMQLLGTGNSAEDIDSRRALFAILNGITCRIKPETVTINGVECPKPNMNAETNWVSIACTNGRESVYCFDSVTHAIAVYEAMIKPFKECKE